MIKKLFVSTALMAAIGAQPALAQNDSRFAAGIKLGTTGAGLELATSLTETLNLRGAYNVFQYDTDFDDTAATYDVEFDKDSVSLLLDWHPGNGGFRITAGAFSHSSNSMDVTASPNASGTFTFNDRTYDASDLGVVSGKSRFEKNTPYLGIGWGNASRARGFTLMLDLGVQFQGSPDVSLASSGCSLPPQLCTQLNEDLEAEAREIEREGEDFEFWPVLNISALYRF